MTRGQAIKYLASSGMTAEQIAEIVTAIERAKTHAYNWHNRPFVELVVEDPTPDMTIYKEYKGKPYLSIKYIEDGKEKIGYGTYSPMVLSQYLKEYFIPTADVLCEITDEQAIEHLQSTGWMQNHDREMYESGLRECLSDDSGSYDSLIPETHDKRTETHTCDYGKDETHSCDYEELDFVQKHERIPVTLFVETHGDAISRQAAIDAVLSVIPYDEYWKEQVEIAVNNLPSAEPERKKGQWILVRGSNGKDYHKCSECLHTQDITGVKNYCAVCGADMRGECDG